MTLTSCWHPRWRLLLGSVLSLGLASGAAQADTINGPFISAPVFAHPTPTLSSLPMAKEGTRPVHIRPRHNPLAHEPDHGLRGTDRNRPTAGGSKAENQSGPIRATPAPLLTFEGQTNTCGGCTPPDTVGDVGPNHYVQMVNATKIAIYNKSGTLLAGYPKEMNSLFTGGNCSISSDGDPVVLYDSLAGRWLLAQFSTGNGVCVAVSKTADPTGAYWGYEFLTPDLPDYLKLGVWHDGYYMSTNETTYSAYALDRAKMLVGRPAASIGFTGETNFMLPSDVDGRRGPPVGSPNYFYTFKDDSFHSVPSDRLEIREFHADFAQPANSTFNLTASLAVTPFNYTVCGFFVLDCIRQAGTAQRLDPVSEWPMFRFPYRNYGGHQALAGTFTVEGATNRTGAVRWFELRKTTSGWFLFQEGTVDSNDGISRTIGSIAMDAAGNLALGYSVSGSSMFPAIRYAVHRIGDALGTMQPETTLRAGGGSQTGSNRWGDYSAMSIDPADDITFWYTNEYYLANSASSWRTRIGKFRILKTATFLSTGANDGYITESSETSGSGGAIFASSSALRVGDDASDRQFMSILDFNTSSLPNAAVITGVALIVNQRDMISGGNPFATLGRIRGDIKKGSFNANAALEPADFQAASSLQDAATLNYKPGSAWFWAKVKATGTAFINKTGRTQIRLRFQTGENDNGAPNYIKFYSGNEVDNSRRPKLLVNYYIP